MFAIKLVFYFGILFRSGIHKCEMCSEAIKHPVLLPCGKQHVFCKQCVELYFNTEQAKRCPICKEDLVEDFECKEQSEVR